MELWKDIPNYEGLYQASITEVCQGKLNKTCGYSFRYLREEEMTY